MSGMVRKVFEEPCDQIGVLGAFPCVVPYVSFYTPGTSSLFGLSFAIFFELVNFQMLT